ncbi:MAG: serine/threonine-protein phosphatase [Gammaproteobacteria bacterium]|nr:serine/threonine-protein phosphatase [Gammaproteobacteria bacterium]
MKDATPLAWVSSALTHVGYVRAGNEDAFLDAREEGLWVVADGMGGHSRGDQASRAVVNSLVSFKRSHDLTQNIENLESRLLAANRACRAMVRGKVIGSTVAALFAFDPFCFFLWAGDSRIYRLRDGQLKQMTEDHSLVQEMCALGELTPEEAEHHPSSNIITRAVGVHDRLRIEMQYTTVHPGDRYLLCSDGLYKDMEKDEIHRLLAAGSADHAVNALVELALERGGTDNVTAIVAQAEYV